MDNIALDNTASLCVCVWNILLLASPGLTLIAMTLALGYLEAHPQHITPLAARKLIGTHLLSETIDVVRPERMQGHRNAGGSTSAQGVTTAMHHQY